MRIQETNKVLNEAQILRNDHERQLAEEHSTWKYRIGSWSSTAMTFLKRPEVIAGVGTLIGVVGALAARPKRKGFARFGV